MMHGSNAGLERIGSTGPRVILTTSAASATSGLTCTEAKGWKNWSFSLVGTFTGYSVLIEATRDGVNFFTIPARADQTGTGIEANPLTTIVQSLSYDKPISGVRATATGTGQTGTVSVLQVQAVP